MSSSDQNPAPDTGAHSQEDREAARALVQLHDSQENVAQDDKGKDGLHPQLKKAVLKYVGHAHSTVDRTAHETPASKQYHNMQASLVQFLEQNLTTIIEPPALNDLKLRCKCTPDEVRQIIRSRIFSIVGSWTALREVVQCYEGHIRKRWSKMTVAKRKKMLSENLPSLPEKHRPVNDIALGILAREEMTTRCFRSVFWPMSNLEDLSRPKNLLLLLNARARNEPHVFAHADLISVRYPPETVLMGPSWLEDVKVLLSANEFPARYGILCIEELKDFPRPHEWAECYDGAEGLFILELQHQIGQDLLCLTDALLRNSPPDSSSDTQASALNSELAPLQPDVDRLTSASMLQAKVADQPYRCPEVTDFDPGYFAAQLQSRFDHREEHVQDRQGRNYEDKKDKMRPIVWAAVVAEMVEGPIKELTHYDHLLNLINQLQDLHQNVDPHAPPSTEANRTYIETLKHFEDRLVDLYTHLAPHLAHLFMASPPGRGQTLRQDNGKLIPKISGDLQGSVIEVRSLIRGTMQMEDTTIDTRSMDCLDDLERLLQSDHSTKALLTPLVAEVIGKVCVVQEAFRQLQADLPWYRAMAYVETDQPAPVKLFGGEDFDSYSSTLEVSMMTIGLYKMVLPDTSNFTYPIAERYSDETIEALETAEINLDKFWSAFDQVFDEIDYSPKFNLERNSFRTPAFDRAVRIMKRWNGLIRHEDEMIFKIRQTDDDVVECAIKSQRPPPIHKYLGQTFAVDARALKVFHTIYWIPSDSTRPGDIEWKELVHAFEMTGIESEKLYGGLWHFTMTLSGQYEGESFFETDQDVWHRQTFWLAEHSIGRIPSFVAEQDGDTWSGNGWANAMTWQLLLEKSRVDIVNDISLGFSRDKPQNGHEWREGIMANNRDTFVYCWPCNKGKRLGEHQCELVGSWELRGREDSACASVWFADSISDSSSKHSQE
ncbi:hypothetical protein M409DRAFT_26282 [Zasmidium cellare ATCC 36951]|uniref:Uncharacterized protein n=1 Tax=Zasmidium cellare ATCC 36951 TaxID=1080233 RepID=A0A6A6CAH6_ZASCE|nr:uncharacterized protein M409DRAFT_26282 [Zasmidium cellare ATCC 36951]KAF2163238.1 hypothetical protein M409DRAFT_26282 [Zasmidium cellare ATCC 36951]